MLKMTRPDRPIALLMALTLVAVPCMASTDLAPGFDGALAAPDRPQEDKDRDAKRKPRAVLEFAGIGAGDRVLDLNAGGGWYTEVLSAAVGPEGHIISQNGMRFADRMSGPLNARAERLGNVEVVFTELADFAVDKPVDAALTALNLHDFANRGEEQGLAFVGAAFRALKPGGTFVVIDHVGIDGQDNSALHRMTVADARAILEKGGFVIEAESDTLHNPADDHTLSMRDPSLDRDTDRFLIRARKPE
jgi:predicted methyltransferase